MNRVNRAMVDFTRTVSLGLLWFFWICVLLSLAWCVAMATVS